MGRGCFPLHQRRVTPEVLEAVVRPIVPMENVNNNLQIIEHDPLARWKAVNRHRANCMVLSQVGFDFAGDRFQLRLGCRRANHEEICKCGDCTQVQNDDVLRLFVRGEFCATPC